MQLDFPLATARLTTLRSGALLVPDPVALFRIEGPGALACLQGLLTSDLAGPGEGSLVYGALLTPKGMIVVDPWVMQEREGFTLLLAHQGREATAQLLRRVLPPRLARVTDVTEAWSAAWLLGAGGLERFARANAAIPPEAGRVQRAGADGAVLLAAGTASAPFSGVLVGPADEVERMTERFVRGGGERAGENELAAARILAGWPSLGREIDERTLPQEVRYDELGAVSYVKGCYTGQETVARVHFRGHVNRMLRGLRLDGGDPPAERALQVDGKDIGTLRSTLLLDDHALALGMVRREVEDGARVSAGRRQATVVRLPFEPTAPAGEPRHLAR